MSGSMRNSNLEFGGFAYGRSETSPDSEEIERTATKLQKRNFPSVEQIQDESLRAYLTEHNFCYVPSNLFKENLKNSTKR